VAALGLFVLPARRRKAKEDLRAKIGGLRQQLLGTLAGQFERGLERSLRHIDEAIAPYTRFIRAKREHLTAARDELLAIREDLARGGAQRERRPPNPAVL